MPSTSNGDVVLYLLDGRSDRHAIVLPQGQSLPPFAAGSDARWRVSATEVAGAHVLFAFNGARLFVCALRGARADLDGAPLDTRWTEAAVPSDLRFGGARVRIGRPTTEGAGAVDEAPEATLVSVETREGEAPHAADGDATRIVDAPSSRAPASRPVPWPALRRPQVRLARREATSPDAPPSAASPDAPPSAASPDAPPSAATLTRSESMTTALLAGLDAPRRRAFDRSAGGGPKRSARAR